MLSEEEVNGTTDMRGFVRRSVCACQCGVKGHGVVFTCFSTREFISLWAACELRGGATLSQHDRIFAIQRGLNNFDSSRR